ncbi:MAG TPA: acyl-CoA dehydrogenase family protein [Stellaceae bacterium]|nr:acyl-CoA dehydrogenase family protein [Stellaceae bacterium]
MDFEDSPAEARFRAEVRDWLAAEAPRFVPTPDADEAERVRLVRAWMRCKADAGYAGFTLPPELGGRGGTALEEIIFLEEQAKVPVAHIETFNLGPSTIIPMLRVHAAPELVAELAAPTIRGEFCWCQLFSEPDAGSDVAAIRTRAVRDGDDWVINGQKVWTSGAHIADWGLLLARTDPARPKHQGLTAFVVPMRSVGVEVRPLKQISGRSEFNEVFFTDLRLPDRLRIGEVNGGWRVVVTTLSNERLALLSDRTVGRNLVGPLLRLAARSGGTAFLDDTEFCARLASYYATVAGVDHIRKRLITTLAKGGAPGPEATVGKMTIARLMQEMAIFGIDLAGAAGEAIDPVDPDLAEIQDCFFTAPGYRMGGGTEEIAKNVVAERVLGLPPEPRADKDVPFNRGAGG